MRTTVEITDEQRAQLLRLAAERGEKGFSHLVQEALTKYLSETRGRRERVVQALSVLGTMDEKSAKALEASVAKARSADWRS